MKTCADCPDRYTCTELCLEMEGFVSQDTVKATEIPISQLKLDVETIAYTNMWIDGDVELDCMDWTKVIRLCKGRLTRLQKKYLYLYYWKGINSVTIAGVYGTTHQNVNRILRDARKKIKDVI